VRAKELGSPLRRKMMNDTQANDRRFLYFYFNRDDPEKIRHIVPAHVEYWQSTSIKGYTGGPFADRTGGLISFVASSLEDAEEIIRRDPFVLRDLIEQRWIKEWLLETPQIFEHG
jgi:uncharacterized protein YciI